MRKLWLDVETTGVDSSENGIIQIACIDEVTGAKFHVNIKPFKDCVYTKDAENVHGKSKKTIKQYVPEREALLDLIKWLDVLQNGREQFSIAGYNSRFDQEFVTAWFKRSDVNFWSYFNYYDIDTFALVKILDIKGFDVETGKPSKKLSAICKTMGVKLKDAHNAMADIKATMKLHKKIVKRYLK